MSDRLQTILIIGLTLLILAGLPFYNQWAYGDWTCVVKNCVQNTPTKNL